MHRRRILQGLGAGAILLGPFVRGLVREARGQTAGRKRFVVLATGNGFDVKRHTPVVRSETDWDLPASLAPLQPYKREVTIVTPLYNPAGRQLHGNGWATLTVVNPVGATDGDRARPGGVSLDRALARTIGKGDPFPSITLALYEKSLYGGGLFVPHLSADGPDKPYPAEWSPAVAFDKIFAGPARSTGVSAEELADRDKSVLDFVRADVRALHARLAGAEREKLDDLLGSLRELEQQLSQRRQRSGGCGSLARPAGIPDKPQSDVTREVVEAHVDVAAHALACGMTSVVHLSLHGYDGPNNTWRFLGPEFKLHEASHGGRHDLLTKVEQYVSGRIVQLRERLAPLRDGGGSLADQTLVMWVNAGGGNHHGGENTHPVVLVGNPGGALRAGRAVILPPRTRCVSDVYVAVATALGSPMSTFGDPAHCKGPLPGLLA